MVYARITAAMLTKTPRSYTAIQRVIARPACSMSGSEPTVVVGLDVQGLAGPASWKACINAAESSELAGGGLGRYDGSTPLGRVAEWQTLGT